MPVGLPQVSSTQEQWRLVAARAMDAWHDFAVYVDLPSASLYKTSCTTALRDLRAAFSSVGYLGYLTSRPLLLILWLLIQYLWEVLHFLGKHLFHHAYVSAGKGWIQLKWGSREFYKWQSALSRTAVLVEISVVAALIGCYMLRRYIQRKKYVQRTASWYRRKKRAVNEVSTCSNREETYPTLSPPLERGPWAFRVVFDWCAIFFPSVCLTVLLAKPKNSHDRFSFHYVAIRVGSSRKGFAVFWLSLSSHIALSCNRVTVEACVALPRHLSFWPCSCLMPCFWRPSLRSRY